MLVHARNGAPADFVALENSTRAELHQTYKDIGTRYGIHFAVARTGNISTPFFIGYTMDVTNPRRVADAFDLCGQVVDVRPCGRGIINDTYQVTIEAKQKSEVILQRINTHVFKRPVWIMENLRTLLNHVRQRQTGARNEDRKFRLPEIYTTLEHEDYLTAPDGGFWRAIGFIENAHSIEKISNLGQAEEVGFALGRFHHLVHELDANRLHETLPGFHETPRYLERYTELVARDECSHDQEQDFCRSFIEARRPIAGVLEEAKILGLLRSRPIHGDPKLDNILFDNASDRAVSLIDLDTLQPGLLQYDIGDCLRSCCNTAGETPDELSAVSFDLDICRAILIAYFDEMRGFLNDCDIEYIYDAIRLIPFELGIRFLNDYLEGNRYFKVSDSEQNLRRALAQFGLTADIEKHQRSIRGMIRTANRS